MTMAVPDNFAETIPSDSVPSSCIVCKEEKQNLLTKLSCGKHDVCRDCMRGKTWRNTRPDPDDIFSCVECRQQPTRPSVYAFMDNSNIWIEAKNLKDNPQIRVDAGQVLKLIESDRIVAKPARLYGSEPPPVDTVWLKINKAGWDLDIKERSPLTNKEKKVDTQIVADATVTICDKGANDNILAIVSGDADMMPVIQVAKERKWQVEVYSWKHAVSSEIKKDSDIKVYYLDDVEDKILFVDIKRLPPEMQEVASQNGIVCKIKPNAFPSCKLLPNADVKIGRFTPSMLPFIEWYTEIKKKFEAPFQCFQLPEADENMLCLVLDIEEAGSDKIARIIDSHAVIPISKISAQKIQTYKQYKETIHPNKVIKKESFVDCKTPLALANQYCQQLSEESDAAMGDNDLASACDQTNGGDKFEDCHEGHQDKQKNECNDIGLAAIKPTTEYKKEKDHSDLDIKSKIQSQPATVSDHYDEAQCDEGEWSTSKSQAIRKKKKFQLYSSPCPNGKDCRYGSKCRYYHTKEEKDFFRNSTRAAKFRKTKPCKNRACPYKKQPVKCNYAHGETDAFCFKCQTKGHFADSCCKQ